MKKVVLTILAAALIASIPAIAQQSINHTKKIYHAPDGKMYIQKSLPIYLYLSTEPDNKGEMHQLQSDSTPEFTNPMYLDTEGYNSFRSPSAVDPVTRETHYPLIDVMYEVWADSRAPETKISYDAVKKYANGKTWYVGKGFTLELKSQDAHSGVEQILVSIDSADYRPYVGQLEFNNEKGYSLSYYAVDNVGNAEKETHIEFIADLTQPKTTLLFEGEKYENNISGRTKLKLEAIDNISGIKAIYYSIDNKNFQLYSYPINAANLSEGDHSLKYFSTDYVGNREDTILYEFYVDKTAPILVDEIMGNSFVVNGKEYSSGRTKLKLTAIDNKSGVKEIQYGINNEAFVIYEEPFYLTNFSGALSIVSYAVDQVGNRSTASEKSTRSRASYVDLTGPELKYQYLGKVFLARDTTYISNETKIKLLASDSESGLKNISYSLNEEAELPYTEPFQISDEGAYTLNMFGYDNVDNSNRESVKLVVDNTGPEIFSRFSVLPISKRDIGSQSCDVYPSHVVLFLSATDSKVAIDRIYYSINGEPEKMYTGIIEGFTRGKDYEILVKAHDKLGNIKTTTIIFGTDNSGPEIFARFSVNPVANKEIDGKVMEVYPDYVSLFLSVINTPMAYDRIYYSINGGKENLYQGIIDGFKAGTIIKMNVRGLDRLGNQTQKEISFKIE